ncbi:MAG: MBL fold metallo-hydrolase [Synergistaceae bacterium]|jgi:glyoxylase-like metal-dependent hydrolase (beta-lactamase superfamily II)|nr:MBL fold metallo-hydrolase [Synergistaceae bacterium]
MELVSLGERTWYIPGRVNVGYYEEGDCGYLIDSGLDDDQGRKVMKLLRETRGVRTEAQPQGSRTLRAIITTHAHPDHIGATPFIQKRTNCEVWATDIEGVLAKRPPMVPLMAWSAKPFPSVVIGSAKKFLEARPSSRVSFIEDGTGPRKIMDTELVAEPLPGHSVDMIGVLTPDRVFFLADAVLDPSVLEKYRFSVMIDIAAELETLNKIETMSGVEWFVPCHAPVVRDAAELVRHNRESLRWVEESILTALSEGPMSREDVFAKIADKSGIELDVKQILLDLSSVSAHLTYLAERGEVEPFVSDCHILWRLCREKREKGAV